MTRFACLTRQVLFMRQSYSLCTLSLLGLNCWCSRQYAAWWLVPWNLDRQARSKCFVPKARHFCRVWFPLKINSLQHPLRWIWNTSYHAGLQGCPLDPNSGLSSPEESSVYSLAIRGTMVISLGLDFCRVPSSWAGEESMQGEATGTHLCTFFFFFFFFFSLSSGFAYAH